MKREEALQMMRVNLQHFAEDTTGTGEGGFDTGNPEYDELLTSLQTDTTAANTNPEPDTPPAADTPSADTDVNIDQQTQSKQNFAFQQMRQENQQLAGLLQKLAQANGIEATNRKDLLEKLNDNAINALAQKQNVSPDLLREMEQLKRDSEAFKQMQYKNNAAQGFQKLVDEHGLDQQKLTAFAIELEQAGVNPFTSQVDIVAEYRNRHFAEATQSMVDKAVAEALARSASADAHSSVPGNTNTPASATTPAGGENKVTTTAGLNSLLNDLGVK